jgi:hypothetical protein
LTTFRWCNDFAVEPSGASFILISAFCQVGSFEVQSCPLRVKKRTPFESIRASSR